MRYLFHYPAGRVAFSISIWAEREKGRSGRVSNCSAPCQNQDCQDLWDCQDFASPKPNTDKPPPAESAPAIRILKIL